jgi:hypothetical protein
VRNGLYSVHVSLADGRAGKGSGVLVFRDGTILGGDAFLFYTGSYRHEGESVRGEVVVNQHTPSLDKKPVFGGREVGIGFSGRFSDGMGELLGTALVGKDSVLFKATLKRLADAT